jgi:uncharacterized lipoprotein YbaY
MMMRNTLVLFLISSMCILTSEGGATPMNCRMNQIISLIMFVHLARKEQLLVLRGRVICSACSLIGSEANAKLVVQLQDTSLADAPALVIAKRAWKVNRFPIAFAIHYSTSKIVYGRIYSLQAMIKNINNELLYINDVHVGVIPMGMNRTKFLDVPVIQVKRMFIQTRENRKK